MSIQRFNALWESWWVIKCHVVSIDVDKFEAGVTPTRQAPIPPISD